MDAINKYVNLIFKTRAGGFRAGDRAVFTARGHRRPSKNFRTSWRCRRFSCGAPPTANGSQATWELLHEFKERGPVVLEGSGTKKLKLSRWKHLPPTEDPNLPAEKIRRIEDEFIPKELQRDYA